MTWSRGATVAAAALLAAAGAHAQPATDRFAPCASCHGEGGVSPNFETPSLAGQHSFYAITQLFLFRAGRRADEQMTKEAKAMSDDDLRAFSDIIGQLPPAAPFRPDPVDPARMTRGAALAAKHRCASCHGGDYSGEKQVPRLAGQREDYLGKALAEFKTGTRIGYTQAMNEALAGLAPSELPDLAHYLAHLGVVAPAPTR
ncbi:MAG TPA: c-type cytochrome [Caldimonas sp.]|nr:c-type cytochrome [Caldimonas sp.]